MIPWLASSSCTSLGSLFTALDYSAACSRAAGACAGEAAWTLDAAVAAGMRGTLLVSGCCASSSEV